MWGKSSQMRVTQNQGGYIYRTPDQGTDARHTVRWRPEWDWRNAWLSFKRICTDFLENHKAANYQDIVHDLLTSYKAMGGNMSLKIQFLESRLDFFTEISAKSVTNTVKDFTKTFWLWKSSTKASGPQVCWQTVAGHWRGTYLTPITGGSHTPLHFRGKFLPVSLVRKVPFCTNRAIFETLPDRKILYAYLN